MGRSVGEKENQVIPTKEEGGGVIRSRIDRKQDFEVIDRLNQSDQKRVSNKKIPFCGHGNTNRR